VTRNPRPDATTLLADLERSARGGDAVVVRDGVPLVAVKSTLLLSLIDLVRGLQLRLDDERRHRGARA